MEFKKSFSVKEALLKAANYCAYQERCYKEVEEKLAEWGIYGTDAGEILIQLSSQNYLNEERFAKAFAGGKFRIKSWGKVKIRLALKAKGISETNIRIALNEIDQASYHACLNKLARQMLQTYDDLNPLIAKQKTARSLMAKGFETNLVWEALNNIQ